MQSIQQELREISDEVRRAPGTSYVVALSGPAHVRSQVAQALAGNLGRSLKRLDRAEYTVRPDQIGTPWSGYMRDARSGWILFFDEADALFGKRTDVHDSHDRYANVEVSYLLAKLSELPGLVIVSSNVSEGSVDATRRSRIRRWLSCHRWP